MLTKVRRTERIRPVSDVCPMYGGVAVRYPKATPPEARSGRVHFRGIDEPLPQRVNTRAAVLGAKHHEPLLKFTAEPDWMSQNVATLLVMP